MRGVLIRIGRFKSLESYYTKVHLKHIKRLWDDFDLRQQASKLANERSEMEQVTRSSDSQPSSPIISFSRWLPSFYDELLLYLEQEWKWYVVFLKPDANIVFIKGLLCFIYLFIYDKY